MPGDDWAYPILGHTKESVDHYTRQAELVQNEDGGVVHPPPLVVGIPDDRLILARGAGPLPQRFVGPAQGTAF